MQRKHTTNGTNGKNEIYNCFVWVSVTYVRREWRNQCTQDVFAKRRVFLRFFSSNLSWTSAGNLFIIYVNCWIGRPRSHNCQRFAIRSGNLRLWIEKQKNSHHSFNLKQILFAKRNKPRDLWPCECRHRLRLRPLACASFGCIECAVAFVEPCSLHTSTSIAANHIFHVHKSCAFAS